MPGFVVGVELILIGVLLVILRKPFARFSLEMREKTWGARYGARTRWLTETITLPVVGGISIVFGVALIVQDLTS